MNEKNLDKTVSLLMRLRINPEKVSPNLVAKVSYDNGIELTSKEIIFISDYY